MEADVGRGPPPTASLSPQPHQEKTPGYRGATFDGPGSFAASPPLATGLPPVYWCGYPVDATDYGLIFPLSRTDDLIDEIGAAKFLTEEF